MIRPIVDCAGVLRPLAALLLGGSVLAGLVERPSVAARSQPPEEIVIDDMVLWSDQLDATDLDSATSIFSVYTRPWPGGVIPVAFDASVSAGQRAQFIRNCNAWGTRAPGVGCVVRTVEPVALNVYNGPLPFSGGQSTVGYSTTARLHLTITPNAWTDLTVLHEVGHAFGFMHEHQRLDRDSYVTIDTSNIQSGYTGAFTVLSPASSQVYGPYDFRSVMHYFPNAFAIDASRPTIIARPPYQAFQNVMGRATTLSDLDLGGIVAIYGVPPEPPTDLTATTGAGSATLSWRQPATGGRPSNFVVGVGTAPGTANLGTFNAGAATTIAGSVSPGTYYARVSAVNESGSSAPTADLAFTVTAVAPPPGAPRDLVVNTAGNTLTLTWQPALAGGSVGSYIVQAGSASGLSDIYTGAVGTSTSLGAVVPLRTYFIRVLAQNSAGASAPSNEVRVDVTSACVVPSAPVLTASRTANLVSAAWTTPAGGPLSHYLLQAGRSPNAVDLFNAPVGLTSSASGVLGPGTYYIRVFAAASCGTSPASNEAMVQVP